MIKILGKDKWKRGGAFIKTLSTLLMVVCVMTFITGCRGNGSDELNQIPKNETENKAPSIDIIAEDLLKSASSNDFSRVNEIIEQLESKKFDPVLLQILHRWHIYRYPNNSDTKLVEALLKRGADPNAKDEDGVPALFLARNAGMLKVLLDDSRADMNARYKGNTLLIEAIGFPNLDKVKLLLDKGADPNEEAHDIPEHSSASDEAIPLFIAIQFDSTNGYQIVNTLLEASRINLNVRNKDGLSPKEFAAKINNTDVLKILENKGVP